MAQCHEFRSLSGGVPKILAACKMLQISITRFQDVALIHIFPTMYGITFLESSERIVTPRYLKICIVLVHFGPSSQKINGKSVKLAV